MASWDDDEFEVPKLEEQEEKRPEQPPAAAEAEPPAAAEADPREDEPTDEYYDEGIGLPMLLLNLTRFSGGTELTPADAEELEAQVGVPAPSQPITAPGSRAGVSPKRGVPAPSQPITSVPLVPRFSRS